ncbi:hypothetical protein K1719_025336 [Acacia pycnantha]|nr:hypothetical protein K1719_025336 [Acacia pycnantha]
MMEPSTAQMAGGPRDRRADALGDLRVLPDEILCAVLEELTPRDVARLACVSSVMYIFCYEEPLWMTLCLKGASGLLQYKSSWKKTALHRENLPDKYIECNRGFLHFDGFNSLYLYRRLYRCHAKLDAFYVDNGNVERRKDISLEDFRDEYDGKKPVMLTGLADAWPARHKWTTDQLLINYGDVAFKISHRSSRKMLMKFKDYVSYMKLQHDEDPLYIFDEKFGEVAPSLLKDYCVPHLFQEDYFDILNEDKRPPYRWLIIGPERSGASWHVDPALTSAWNTLLSGRKRWALYPPGKVPLGVTVHVNEEDGDVNIETPSSLQWWLDFYPLLADEDKPIECTQLPGETIYVPSGWWHCVLNLETTIAVTQNFVNFSNFEFVCLDMAPGYRHKGVCRAGLLALDDDGYEDVKKNTFCDEQNSSHSILSRREKRARNDEDGDDLNNERTKNGASRYNLWKDGFSYDINFLSMFLDKDRDHYRSPWSSGNSIGQRELREWLSKLWVGKPEMRELIWKGACIALNADKWSECLYEICSLHNMPSPLDDERLPVGTGSNPVFLVGNTVLKIFVEGGLEAALYGLGTELEFYNILHEVNSPLKNHIPEVLGCGILCLDNGTYTNLPWDGKGVPDIVTKNNLTGQKCGVDDFSFGKIFAELRDRLSREDVANLATFLGEKLRHIHLLPRPPLNILPFSNIEQDSSLPKINGNIASFNSKSSMVAEWEVFIGTLTRRRKDVLSRLTKWGDPIPRKLIEKVDEYIPHLFANMLNITEGNALKLLVRKRRQTMFLCDSSVNRDVKSWRPSYILDFSDLSIGDPIFDLIPIYLDVFRGDSYLLKLFLESYKLPFAINNSKNESTENDDKFGRLSYLAMCYCILHHDDVLGAVFSIWDELRSANSWEEVELTVWGELNNYKGFP